MTAVEVATVAQPVVAAFAAIGQIAFVVWGIRAVIAANEDRAAAAAKAARRAARRHADAMAARAETMAGYEVQAEADRQRHVEAMTASNALNKALDTQSKALETLIERTAPGTSDR